ncbi:hypothetical protein MTO96_032696 [Rhipicephalus appendiculatus]
MIQLALSKNLQTQPHPVEDGKMTCRQLQEKKENSPENCSFLGSSPWTSAKKSYKIYSAQILRWKAASRHWGRKLYPRRFHSKETSLRKAFALVLHRPLLSCIKEKKLDSALPPCKACREFDETINPVMVKLLIGLSLLLVALDGLSAQMETLNPEGCGVSSFKDHDSEWHRSYGNSVSMDGVSGCAYRPKCIRLWWYHHHEAPRPHRSPLPNRVSEVADNMLMTERH